MSITIAEQLPSTAQDYIRRFDERWLGLQVAEPQDAEWVTLLAETIEMESPLMRLPIASMNIRYVETRADNRDQDTTDRFFDLGVVEFDAGVEEQLLLLNQFKFKRDLWDKAPALMKAEETEHEASGLAAALIANAAPAVPANSIDGVALFSASHPTAAGPTAAGPTWSNINGSGGSVLNVANIQAEAAAMATGVLGPDGRLLRAQMDTIMVPTGLVIPLANLLGQAFIPNAAGTATQSNPYFSGVRVVGNPYLTDPNDWYAIDSRLIARGYKPLIRARFDAGPDLGLRRFDESSDHFKSTGRVKLSSHIFKGYATAWPQAIRKVVVA